MKRSENNLCIITTLQKCEIKRQFFDTLYVLIPNIKYVFIYTTAQHDYSDDESLTPSIVLKF